MIVVSDTSPITNLSKIGKIDLLRELFETVIIPDAVFDEISAVESQLSLIAELDWIKRGTVTDFRLLDELLDTLDRGEAEAITLAIELSADLILIDESLGREEAKSLDLEITGILGILIRAKESGLIPLVEPEIQKLRTQARFWVTDDLIEKVLRNIGEK